LDFSGSGQGPLKSSGEHGDGPSVAVEHEELIDRLSHYWFLRNDYISRRHFVSPEFVENSRRCRLLA